MFFFHRRRTGGPGEEMRRDPTGDPLLFDSSRIVLAIAFHLLDEGLAAAVDAASRDAVARGLADRGVRLDISQARWAAMDNRQRLRWLLAEATTGVTFGPGRVAVLSLRGLPMGAPSHAPHREWVPMSR